MKKYKLIKEYPGSPKLNDNTSNVISLETDGYYHNNCNIYNVTIHSSIIEKYKEFWEEIIEKDYEIISYKNFLTGSIHTIGQMFFSNEGYRKFSELDVNSKRIEDGRKVYSIYSIKRLSDGKIFSVGDKVYSKFTKSINSWKNCFVHAFIIKNNKIKFQIIENETKGIYTLEEIQHYKKPLFTTEDGVDIYHGQRYYVIDHDAVTILERKANYSFNSKYIMSMKRFAIKENAEKYVFYNTARTLIEICEKLLRNNK